jgi:dipeptidyl aminopeptidase/acylaminoacyl peptidase
MDLSGTWRRGVVILLASLLLGQLPAARGQGGADRNPAWTPEACFTIKKVGDVQPSPDGKRVVYTVTETVLGDSSASEHTHVYVAHADGTGATPLTKGEGRPGSPQWSADGAWIAYLVNNSLCRVRPDGTGGETLTQNLVVTSFKWSPDGTALAFIETAPAPKKPPGVGLVVGEDIFSWRPPHARLCLVSTSKDADGHYPVRRLTGDDSQPASFDWSPDSKHIALTRFKRSDPPTSATPDLWLVNVATGAPRTLTTPGAAVRDPHFSPDGRWIACTVSDGPPTWTGSRRVQLIPFKEGAPKLLAPTFDDAPALVGWSADGGKLYYVEAHRTAVRLFALPLEGKPVALSEGDSVVGDKADGWVRVHLNATRTMVGFTRQTPRRPPEAFVSKVDAFHPVQITRVNDDLRKLPLARTEVVRWKSQDGTSVEGLLTYPLGYAPGKRYPLLLLIHGGPNAVYSQTFLANPSGEPVATFAERGFAVLRCNPRGSTGYGVKFRQGNHKDWGGGDYQDLMAGVDHVIGLGVADDKRLGVLGYSYGGFLAAWAITHTQRFRAASVGAGITNLVSFAGTTAVTSILPSYYGGAFWDNRELLQKQSPVFHVQDVTTPTLIYHGDQDVIAPVGQGYELYNALKRQGCVTQMVVYPGATHNPGAFRTLDIMRRNLAWMDRYVK